MNKSNAFIRKSFRNCCYVSQHYSSHLRLTRQQDVDHLLGGYNRKGHCVVLPLHPKIHLV